MLMIMNVLLYQALLLGIWEQFYPLLSSIDHIVWVKATFPNAARDDMTGIMYKTQF